MTASNSRSATTLQLASLVALALLAAPSDLRADPPAGTFPNPIQQGDRTLVVNGTGLVEWGFFAIDLYWAALYLEEKTSDVREILDSSRAKRVELYFVRALTRAQMIEAYTASVKVNAGKQLPKYQKALDQLTAVLTAVAKKDSLAFTYIPEHGLTIEFNGKRRGVIADPAFARLFFQLYVGSKPPTEALKKGLLGSHPKKKSQKQGKRETSTARH